MPIPYARAVIFIPVLVLLLLVGAVRAEAQTPSLLAPLVRPGSATPPAPWRTVGLPGNRVPLSDLAVVELEGSTVLRVQADRSYGTLVHPVAAATPPRPDTTLQWRWRLDEPLRGANLMRRDGDDVALRVCVLYDMPLSQIPFLERSLLRLARSVSGEPLPSAAVCYVWDGTLPVGTLLPNVYSRRVRTLVLQGADAPLAQWRTEKRNLAADFLRAFGDEASSVPPVAAVVVGADADNTGGRSLGYVAALELLPP
jgi:hypothetical protein